MNLNTLKGIFVILVIMDHNEFSRSLFPRFLDGFGFHVLGFMMIPFLRPAQPLGRGFLQYLFRLYFPFFVIATVMALVVAALTPVPPAVQAGRWLLSLYSGNSSILKETTRMALLWFLPSFVAMVAIRTALDNSGAGAKAAGIALLCLAHPFIGAVADRIEHFLPLGLLPAIYVIPLAYLGVLAQRRVFEPMTRGIALAVTLALYLLAKYAQMHMGLRNEIGFAAVSDYTDPVGLLLNDLEAVTGVLMLFQVSRFPLGRFLETCGRYSLQLYLFHAFLALLVYRMLLKLAPGWGPLPLFAVSMAATVVLSVMVGRFVAEHRLLKRLLFPRNTGELFGRRKDGGVPATMPYKDMPKGNDIT